MQAGPAFVSFLLLTVLLLLGVLVTGLKARRRQHITLVCSALVSLGVTIYFAEKLGESYDIHSAGVITPIHLTLAKITVLAYLLPIVTGIRTLRDGRHRRLHRKLAFLVLGLTLLTTGTGTAMLLLSERLPG